MNHSESTQLLQALIRTESFSRQEHDSAELIFQTLLRKGLNPQRILNNVWVKNMHFREGLPVLLLHSHHDTVRPNASYTRNPFEPEISDGKLYGLGSNDAGASLVCLLAAFLHFNPMQNLPFNLIFAAGAEEEISGPGGAEALLAELGTIDMGIVGEPTGLQMAVAEKGLLVVDCESHGIPGHAAREEGVNAIYEALPDICWFRDYRFPMVSDLLGPVKMSVTLIQAGQQHNMVPDLCRFTADIRYTEAYTAEEILLTIDGHTRCRSKARSTRLRPSFIPAAHPLRIAGTEAGLKSFGSSTLSDQALMPFPTIKLGPGESARSHSADEFIYLNEMEDGCATYIRLIETLQKHI